MIEQIDNTCIQNPLDKSFLFNSYGTNINENIYVYDKTQANEVNK